MGRKAEIADKLVAAIKKVTKDNGYTQDVKKVSFDQVKVNIADYADYELPAVQIIDITKVFTHLRGRSQSRWVLGIEICMRSHSTSGTVDQQALWNLEEDIIHEIFKTPQLELSYVIQAKLLDGATDLHLHGPEYIAIIGLEIEYYEQITPGVC